MEIVTRNDTTTASNEEKTNQTVIYNDSVIYDEIAMIPILAGVLMPIILFCMMCVIYRKGKTMDFGLFILLNMFHILQHVVGNKTIVVITINLKSIKL